MTMQKNIHPQAIIEEGATIDPTATIEPFAIIKKNVTIGAKAVIKAHAYIDGHTFIGDETVIWPFASIGTKTQDKKFRGETTYVKIGRKCEIREYVTINSSCGEGTEVTVGDGCLIMTSCHIAHNCQVGNGVIMSNNAALAGHVTVEDYAIIGGYTPIHQFCTIGKHAMVGGGSRVVGDVPPFFLGGDNPWRWGGINRVGLERSGFSQEAIRTLFKAFKILIRSSLPIQEAIQTIEKELPKIPEIEHLLKFCKASKRGIMGNGAEEMAAQEDESGRKTASPYTLRK